MARFYRMNSEGFRYYASTFPDGSLRGFHVIGWSRTGGLDVDGRSVFMEQLEWEPDAISVSRTEAVDLLTRLWSDEDAAEDAILRIESCVRESLSLTHQERAARNRRRRAARRRTHPGAAVSPSSSGLDLLAFLESASGAR